LAVGCYPEGGMSVNGKRKIFITLGIVGLLLFPHWIAGKELPCVMSIREQVETVNRITSLRLDTLLPRIMRETGFDMWIILTQEDNVDAVFRTMVPMNTWNRRDLILVFYDRGPEKGVERLNVSRMNTKGLHRNAWDYRAGKETRWECLARIIRERDPEKIGINESATIWAADGLSATLEKKLTDTIDKRYIQRLHSAEKLSTLWLETLLEEELDLYERAVQIAHALIAETYSSEVITSGVTTVDDLIYHYWQRAANLGLPISFNPSFSIRGRGPDVSKKYGKEDRVIRRGDLLHCDVGVVYLRYYTDHQEWAYVLRRGETEAPESFRKIMEEGNKLQDIFCSEFKAGLTGNQLLHNILRTALDQGIEKPRIYSHSVGYCLHEPGPLIGLPEEQENTGGRGDVRLVYDSTFTIELSVTRPIPELDGQDLRMGLEQMISFTREGTKYLDGRQTQFYLVK
jgi:Xaa-Pro aminopeptidase